MLKPLVPKFRPDRSVHLTDTLEKRVPAKLKPIVVVWSFGEEKTISKLIPPENKKGSSILPDTISK